MRHTYQSVLVHCVWATKDRLPTIPADARERLHDFLGGCAREIGATSLRIGGTSDHVHVLLRVPSTLTVATAVQKLKANSSRWMHTTSTKPFAWQDGYGAFSVSVSHVANTIAYIERQEEHHRKRDFTAEWNSFLKTHGFCRNRRCRPAAPDSMCMFGLPAAHAAG